MSAAAVAWRLVACCCRGCRHCLALSRQCSRAEPTVAVPLLAEVAGHHGVYADARHLASVATTQQPRPRCCPSQQKYWQRSQPQCPLEVGPVAAPTLAAAVHAAAARREDPLSARPSPDPWASAHPPVTRHRQPWPPQSPQLGAGRGGRHAGRHGACQRHAVQPGCRAMRTAPTLPARRGQAQFHVLLPRTLGCQRYSRCPSLSP